MTAYYIENDVYAAQWLRNLITAGRIPDGDVDGRSICDVQPSDLTGYTQCHFFAGLGGWPYALQLAARPTDKPVWTGSCPCQPFSQAGKQKGFSDERHLWPEFHRLIAARRPATIFGEQVTSAVAHGWLDLVSTDLENLGYAFGAADLCAAGIGAPHIRQRVFWVGHAERQGLEGWPRERRDYDAQLTTAQRTSDDAGRGPGFWNNAQLISCRDGKMRPIEPGIRLLAHGIPSRVAKLRALGNAIVPQVAAEFIKAIMSCGE